MTETEDPRIANARRVLTEIDAEDADAVILAASLRMLLTYVDGESFDEWSARVTAEADQ